MRPPAPLIALPLIAPRPCGRAAFGRGPAAVALGVRLAAAAAAAAAGGRDCRLLPRTLLLLAAGGAPVARATVIASANRGCC